MTTPVPEGALPGAAPPRVRRAPVFVALAALVVAGVVADRIPRPPAPRVGAGALGGPMPVAAPDGALSSTWFCAGATALAEGVEGLVADGRIVVANAGDAPVRGTVTVVPSDGEPRTVPIEVPARGVSALRQREVLSAPYVSALVELDGGAVVVEHEISGPPGFSTAPCASSASDRWYLAEGSTAREDSLRLAIFNPFPEDAIVDLSFATDQGRAVPADFTGIVVKGGRMRIVKVEEHVRRRAHVATTAVARSGRVVVDRLQLRGGAVKGISLALAAPAPGPRWYFPEGLVTEGVTERYHLYNPTDSEAQVSIELTLEEGAAEPFDLTVPPRDRLTVVANEQERVPRDVAHAATVVSLNDVPVVAERSVTAVAPAARAGAADTHGAARTARQWVLASGSATETVDEVVVVHNPGATAAEFSVHALVGGQLLPVEGLQGIALPAGKRTTLRLTDHIKRADLALLVRSSAPVVVERGMYLVGSPGIALSLGVPLR